MIGKRGAGVETLKKEVQALTENEVFLNIIEVRKAETNAQLVAENIATQLERRIAFRRAMKKATQTAMKFGAKGIKVASSGRLGGAEMCRREWYKEGRVPLHTLRADIEYGFTEAHTTYGSIGVKAWVFHGEVLPDRAQGPPRRAPRPLEVTAPCRCFPPSGRSSARCRRAAPAASPRAATRSRSATSDCRSLSPGWITARQIEAARVAISRSVKKFGKIYVRVFPDHPFTKKPAETRMGTGKGGVEG